MDKLQLARLLYRYQCIDDGQEDRLVQRVALFGWAPQYHDQGHPFARANTALDNAVFQIAVDPTKGVEELLDVLTEAYGLKERPESTGERQANDLTWSLYTLEAQGLLRDIALAESEGSVLIVILRSAADERDALYDAIFLPVVDALAPLE